MQKNKMLKDPIVKAVNINLSYNDQVILKDINLTINSGEIITLIGPNGSGKTSLSKIILGLIKPDSGSYSIKAGIKIGYMPQKMVIDNFFRITVADFLTLRTSNKQSIHQWIEEIGIANLLNKQINKLSGGEMQKVLLTNSLTNSPDLLVLDEPVQGVDITGQTDFYRLIENIRNKRNTAILMVSHDLYMVMRATDKVYCLNHHICCAGTPEDVSIHPEYIALFGPEAMKTISIYSHHHDHTHNH